MRTKYQLRLIVVGLSLLLSLIMFKDIILNNDGLLWFYGDSIEQQYNFALGYWQIFRDFNFNIWNWSLGFGGNIFSYIFYNLFSPFNLITFVLPKHFVQYSFLYLTIIKFAVFALFGCMWLEKLFKSKYTIIIISLMLTFCGWNMFYLQYNFLDAFVFYPLILYFLEVYLNQNKKLGFIVSVFALTIVNYYFMYMFAPFLLLYIIGRIIILNGNVKINVLLINITKKVTVLILSMFLAGFILLPCAYLVIKTPRLADESLKLFRILPINDIIKVISSLYVPVFNYTDPNYFVSPDKLSYMGWGSGASLYLSALVPVFTAYYVINGKSKYKKVLLSIGFLLVVFILIPIFYKLFQGTIDTRWYYMAVFYFALIGGIVLDEIFNNNINCKNMWVACVFNIALLAIIYVLAYKIYLNDFSKLDILKPYIIQTIIMMVAATILITLKYKYLLLILMIFNVIWSNNIFIGNNIPIAKEQFNNNLEYEETIHTIKNVNKNGFYRVLFDNYNDLSANQPFASQVAGNSFYLSLYSFEQESFMQTMKSRWSMPQGQGFYGLRSLLSNKYYLNNQSNGFNPIGYIETITPGVYENTYYYPLGYFDNSVYNNQVLIDKTAIERDYIISNYIISESFDQQLNVKLPQFEVLSDYSLGPYIEMVVQEELNNEIIIIENGGIPDVRVTMYYNDEVVYNQSFWQYHYIEVYIPEDKKVDRIELNINDVDQTGLSVRILKEVDGVENYITRQNFMIDNQIDNVVVYKANMIKAHGYLEEDSVLFTSIPFDKGWSVKLNDKQVQPILVNEGFLGVEVPKGEYKLQFTYSPPWSKVGIILSFASLILLTILNKKVKL